MKIAIIGYGSLGKAHQVLFPDAYIYTRHIGTKEEVNKCDLAFICIPAIWNEEQQRLDTTGIEEILGWCTCKYIIIKTTLNVGDTDNFRKIYNKTIFFSPEFLRDKHWKYDIMHEDKVLIGISGNWAEGQEVCDLYNEAYGREIAGTISAREAEFFKLFTNTFLASKVTIYAQLLHNYTSKLFNSPEGVEWAYQNLRDKRINESHTTYKGKWGGKCFPKDYRAMIALGKKIGADTSVLEAIWKYNETQSDNS